MDKVSEAKGAYRLRQWSQIVQDCQASNMTVVAWCRQNNVNIKSYYYWLRKVRSKAICKPDAIQLLQNQQIVPVALGNMKTATVVTIHLPTVSVDIHDGASKSTIDAVLASLKSIC